MADDTQRTWDGQPISGEAPTGAAIVVYRRRGPEVEYLLLHRAHHGTAYEGDWAWGSPSGCRYPGEPIHRCAERELHEETGLRLPLQQIAPGDADWVVYLAEAPAGAEVRLSAEHDAYRWLPFAPAVTRIAPATVRANVELAAQAIGDGTSLEA